MVEVSDGNATVRGLGAAYRVRRGDGGVTVATLSAGAVCYL